MWRKESIGQQENDYGFWVNRLFELIEDREYKNVIITDVRYISEVDSIVERKGVLLKMVRDIDRVKAIHGTDHISEVDLDEYNDSNFVIDNNGTLKELKVAANETAKVLIEKNK